jgi:ribosomal protein S21
MPETRRKPKESFEGLLRRFGKQVQQSGKILQAKKIRYYARPKSVRAKKIAALRREKIEQKKEYLRKVGKLKERFPGVKALMKM